MFSDEKKKLKNNDEWERESNGEKMIVMHEFPFVLKHKHINYVHRHKFSLYLASFFWQTWHIETMLVLICEALV